MSEHENSTVDGISDERVMQVTPQAELRLMRFTDGTVWLIIEETVITGNESPTGWRFRLLVDAAKLAAISAVLGEFQRAIEGRPAPIPVVEQYDQDGSEVFS